VWVIHQTEYSTITIINLTAYPLCNYISICDLLYRKFLRMITCFRGLLLGAWGIKHSGCARASVRPWVWVRFPPLYLVDERMYFDKLNTVRPTQYHAHMTRMIKVKVIGLTVKVRQRWSQKSCKLDSPWTTRGIWTETYITRILHVVQPQSDQVFKVTSSKVKVTDNNMANSGGGI